MHVVERGLRVWPAPNVKIKQRQKCFRDTHLIRTPCTGAPEDHFLYYICSEFFAFQYCELVRKGNLKFSDSKMQLRGESEKFTLS